MPKLQYQPLINLLSSLRKKQGPSQEEAFGRSLEDMLMPTRIVFNTRHAEQNDFYRKTIAVKNYPASLKDNVCILQKLATLKGSAMKIFFNPLNSSEVSTLFNRQMNNKTASKTTGGNSSDKFKSSLDEKNLQDSYSQILSNNERVFYVTILIEVYASDKVSLQKKVDEVKNKLAAYGITKDDLIYEQLQAYKSVLPTGDNLMEHMCNNLPSSTISALYPFSASNRHDPEGMLLGSTTDGGNIFLDVWLRDEKNTNGNIVVIGESGQGKSTLVKKIMELQIARGTSVFMLDPEGEYDVEIERLGGTVIDCAAGNFIINPLEIRRITTKEIEDEIDREEKNRHIRGDLSSGGDKPSSFKEVNPFKQHLSWLRDFYGILRPYATEAELNILIILTQNLYYERGITETTDISLLSSDDYPTMGDLYDYIFEVYSNFPKYEEKFYMFKGEALQNILLFLKDVYDGAESDLFNGHTNVINADVINFNLNTLLQGAHSRSDAAMFNIMTWIWNKVTLRIKQIMLGIDELYLLMNRNNLTMAEYLRNFSKRARKYEALICTATQNLKDFLDPQIEHMSSVLFNNPNHKFIFYPGDLDFSAVKGLLHLTNGEMELISESNKGHCLLKSGGSKYYVHIKLLDYEKELFGTGGGR